MSAGRPRCTILDDPDKVNEICEMIIEGNSIRSILGEEGMPATTAFYREMDENPEFRNAIARAKEIQQDNIIDSMIDLADTATPENVNVVKLQIWARQWRAMKLYPKKYGEQKGQDVTVNLHNHLAITEERMEQLRQIKRESIARQGEVKKLGA